MRLDRGDAVARVLDKKMPLNLSIFLCIPSIINHSSAWIIDQVQKQISDACVDSFIDSFDDSLVIFFMNLCPFFSCLLDAWSQPVATEYGTLPPEQAQRCNRTTYTAALSMALMVHRATYTAHRFIYSVNSMLSQIHAPHCFTYIIYSMPPQINLPPLPLV